MNTIKKFKKYLNKSMNKINKSIKMRNSQKIHFKDVIYYCSYLIGNNKSYDIVNSYLKIHNILNVSKKSLIKNRNDIKYIFFKELNNYLLLFIYSNIEKRIIAVDGSHINLLKVLEKEGFILSTNGNYCSALVSTLFDVDRELPINYNLVMHKNERIALLDQLKYLKNNDILIMDRGYFSNKLLFELHNNKIKTIFRLKKNLKIIKSMILSKQNDKIIYVQYNHKKIKFRLIKYMIADTEYFLGTTIYDKSIDYFINLYWKRWKVEINLRQSKHNLTLRELKSKTKNSIYQDLMIHNLIFIISGYFINFLQPVRSNKFKISTVNMLTVTINELLYLLIYKSTTNKTINEILRIINIAKKSDKYNKK